MAEVVHVDVRSVDQRGVEVRDVVRRVKVCGIDVRGVVVRRVVVRRVVVRGGGGRRATRIRGVGVIGVRGVRVGAAARGEEATKAECDRERRSGLEQLPPRELAPTGGVLLVLGRQGRVVVVASVRTHRRLPPGMCPGL
ncbi:MAG: hypothetical protein EXQ79_00940 [Acidimicrobiia bacterium]|nr:hypothetical protein [Acidimicrobiia bacterium]